MRNIHIPIFVTHMGCPHDCSFCNQRAITKSVVNPTGESVTHVIDEHIKTIHYDASIVEVAFFGGSFTAVDMDYQIQLLEAVQPFIKAGKVNSIRLSTRPDAIDAEKLSILREYNVDTIELGVQSMCDSVLDTARRGHGSVDVVRSAELIKQYGFNLGVQQMTGLMYDTDEIAVETAKKLIALEPKCVRIYPTLVIEGTHLAQLYKSGTYKPQTIESAVNLCALLYDMYVSNGVSVIRMGLMANEDIHEGSEAVLAGPVHSSFGELVKSEVFYNRIVEGLENYTLTGKICINPKDISIMIGNKGFNRDRIEKLIGREIKFVCVDDVERV